LYRSTNSVFGLMFTAAVNKPIATAVPMGTELNTYKWIKTIVYVHRGQYKNACSAYTDRLPCQCRFTVFFTDITIFLAHFPPKISEIPAASTVISISLNHAGKGFHFFMIVNTVVSHIAQITFNVFFPLKMAAY